MCVEVKTLLWKERVRVYRTRERKGVREKAKHII